MADLIIAKWLNLWNKATHYKYVSPKAQHMSIIKDKEKALIEIIKYGSKIFTEPDVNNKSKGNNDSNLHAAALDNIFNAMKGLRIFDRFGFDLPKESRKETKATAISDFDSWQFDPRNFNWVNVGNEKRFQIIN